MLIRCLFNERTIQASLQCQKSAINIFIGCCKQKRANFIRVYLLLSINAFFVNILRWKQASVFVLAGNLQPTFVRHIIYVVPKNLIRFKIIIPGSNGVFELFAGLGCISAIEYNGKIAILVVLLKEFIQFFLRFEGLKTCFVGKRGERGGIRSIKWNLMR